VSTPSLIGVPVWVKLRYSKPSGKERGLEMEAAEYEGQSNTQEVCARPDGAERASILERLALKTES
jgi:hypothetical protein